MLGILRLGLDGKLSMLLGYGSDGMNPVDGSGISTVDGHEHGAIERPGDGPGRQRGCGAAPHPCAGRGQRPRPRDRDGHWNGCRAWQTPRRAPAQPHAQAASRSSAVSRPSMSSSAISTALRLRSSCMCGQMRRQHATAKRLKSFSQALSRRSPSISVDCLWASHSDSVIGATPASLPVNHDYWIILYAFMSCQGPGAKPQRYFTRCAQRGGGSGRMRGSHG